MGKSVEQLTPEEERQEGLSNPGAMAGYLDSEFFRDRLEHRFKEHARDSVFVGEGVTKDTQGQHSFEAFVDENYKDRLLGETSRNAPIGLEGASKLHKMVDSLSGVEGPRDTARIQWSIVEGMVQDEAARRADTFREYGAGEEVPFTAKNSTFQTRRAFEDIFDPLLKYRANREEILRLPAQKKKKEADLASIERIRKGHEVAKKDQSKKAREVATYAKEVQASPEDVRKEIQEIDKRIRQLEGDLRDAWTLTNFIPNYQKELALWQGSSKDASKRGSEIMFLEQNSEGILESVYGRLIARKFKKDLSVNKRALSGAKERQKKHEEGSDEWNSAQSEIEELEATINEAEEPETSSRESE